MRIVITGSSGRIGRALVVRLRHGHEVVGFDRSPASVTDVVAELSDEPALAKAIGGADAVIHTAALHAPEVPYESEATFLAVNVEGTRAVIRSCLAAGVGSLVYTSTTALYGDAATPGERAGWVTEETVPTPRTIYHRTKLTAESLLREAAAGSGLPVTVLRMSRCFPEPAPVMACYRLHRGIDARDVASAHELALRSSKEAFRCFVISGTTPFLEEDVDELKSSPAAVLERRAPDLVAAFAQRGWTLPDTIDRVYCARKAERELGWRPRFGYQEVLRQLDEESPEVLPTSRQRSA